MTTPIKTLQDALAEAALQGLSYKVQAHTPEEFTIRTGPLDEPDSPRSHSIYNVIRTVLRAHAIEGQGTVAGALEHYPLVNGRVFSVTWVGGESDPEGGYTPQSAILNIAKPMNAF